MKKIIGMALCLSMTAMLFTGCSSSGSGGADKKDSSGNNKVGVALPTKELQRWNQDGANIKKERSDTGENHVAHSKIRRRRISYGKREDFSIFEKIYDGYCADSGNFVFYMENRGKNVTSTEC